MDPTENSLMMMKTWQFCFLLLPQITEDFPTLWDVQIGFFPQAELIHYPFPVPLGESQASHLLCDWRLRVGLPQILSPFWVFLLFPGLLPRVSWGCVLWDALGPCGAARAGAELSIAGRGSRVTLLYHPISLGGSGGGELTP